MTIQCLLYAALGFSWLGGIVLLGELRFLHRKVLHMSASLDRLKAAAAAVATKVAELEARPAGTPDSDLDAVSSVLEGVVSASAPPTEPTPPAAA